MSNRLNIIHLYDETEHAAARMANIRYQLEEQEISDYEIWPGIKHHWPYKGIRQAHRQIVQHAKENNLPEVCIAEDDIAFLGKGAFDFFVRSKPAQYDIFLGSVSQILKRDGDIIKSFTGFTLYFVHQRFYDRYLNAPERDHIDKSMTGLGDFYLCPKVVCGQMAGYSYNKRRYMNYSNMIDQYEKYDAEKDSIQTA